MRLASVEPMSIIEEVDYLYKAVNKNTFEIAQFLIDHGAQIESKNRNGNTALHIAAGKGSLEVVKFLVESGAYIDMRNNHNQTPVYISNRNGHKEIAKYLLERKRKQDY